jgi:hypothetical protein
MPPSTSWSRGSSGCRLERVEKQSSQFMKEVQKWPVRKALSCSSEKSI